MVMTGESPILFTMPMEDFLDLVKERDRMREVLQMWAKFWAADNDDNLLEPLLAEEAMEATREILGEDE
jgi:hypothetical protein